MVYKIVLTAPAINRVSSEERTIIKYVAGEIAPPPYLSISKITQNFEPHLITL